MAPTNKPHHYAIVPKYMNCFVILISLMMIKVSNKVIDSLNRIYLNEYFILLFIYLVSDYVIITY